MRAFASILFLIAWCFNGGLLTSLGFNLFAWQHWLSLGFIALAYFAGCLQNTNR